MIHQFVIIHLMVFQRQDIYLSVLLPLLACMLPRAVKIWDAYREFEHSIFNAIDQTDIQAKQKQLQRIRGIFNRQLSVPLANLKSTLIAYKAWEVEQGNILDPESDDVHGISSQVPQAYNKALEMYNARAHLEEEIARQDSVESEKFQHFMSYLKFEQSSGDPARVQILYERPITDFPVSSDLWLDYTRYLDKTLKVGSVVRDVYSRATRNCPWIGELWVRYLLSLERGHASEKDISAVYEKSLQCTFSTLEEVSPRLEELKLFRLQQESISLTATTDQREHTLKKTAREKRKSGSKATDEQSPAKRQKNDRQDLKKLNQNSNSQEQNKTAINEGDETKDKVGEPENEKQIKDSSAPKNKVYTDQCTAFVSNRHLKANDEDLRQFFSDVGGVTSIRILHDKFTGKSRVMEKTVIFCFFFIVLCFPQSKAIDLDVVEAGSYDPSFSRTACDIIYPPHISPGEVVVAVGEELWENGRACHERYQINCISEAYPKSCKPGALNATVIDYVKELKSKPSKLDAYIFIPSQNYTMISADPSAPSIMVQIQKI